jgi:hypothetical protein
MQWITSDPSCSNALQTSGNKIALLQSGRNETRSVIFFLGCWGLQSHPQLVEPGPLIWGVSESKILLNLRLSENMCRICTYNIFGLCYKHKFRASFINHCHGCYTGWFASCEPQNNNYKKQINSVALVRERTISTERPPLVGEVGANYCVVSATDPYGRILGILDCCYLFSHVAPQLCSRSCVDPVPDRW